MNNGGNIMQMQQEAAERVQRMQERSRRLAREYPVHVYRGVTLTPSDVAPAPPLSSPPLTDMTTPCTDEPPPLPTDTLPPTEGTLAALLHGDQEQTLVLLLAIILAKNGAPLELVLALLYVAM